MKLPLLLTIPLAVVASLLADGPADNIAEKVRPVPPPGVKIPDAAREELTAGAAVLAKDIESLRNALKNKPALLDLLPDVQIYHKAVDWALRYDEFFNTNQVNTARNFLKQGAERAAALREGKAPWLAQTGLVARGYQSRIDGSVQPYGMVVPPGFVPGGAPLRLDFWFHGRGEVLSELAFVDGVQRNPGQFVPPNTLVLHLYGRYCCANKLAGEVDLFEAFDHARKYYPVDDSRLVARGFSMGGAACWQFAVHYPGFFCAAAPGAGFSETPDFLKVFQNETLKPAWFEQKLWRMYDCTDYAVNLFNLPTVAYSGEIDRQKQAADIMEAAIAKEGIQLTHIIGPKTAHSYHPGAKTEINRRIDAIAARGRDTLPWQVKFTTFTLRYNKSHWVTIDGMEEHWERARVDADIEHDGFKVVTKGVTALTLSIPSGRYPFAVNKKAKVTLDGARFEAPLPGSDRSWAASFAKIGRKWELVRPAAVTRLSSSSGTTAKQHGLQGPIDDAFLDSFLMVLPSGTAMNETVGRWTQRESEHAIDHWRKQYRGDARVKQDTTVTDDDIAAHNLVLWGDPQSNKLLARIADRLPVKWTASTVMVGAQCFDAGHHAPAFVYPNPLNPGRYIVINSGFTFREYDYLNNARQVPKLPDWAVVDLRTPPNSRWPGAIAAADFFNEKWEVKPARK